MPTSFMCADCGAPQSGLVTRRSDAVVVRPCTECGRPCDVYLEHEPGTLFLGIALLRPAAWRHAVYNRHSDGTAELGLPGATIAVIATFALLLEVLVLVLVDVDANGASLGNGTHGTPSSSSTPLVDVLHQQAAADVAARTLRLLPYCAMEAVVAGLALVWAVSAFVARRGTQFSARAGARAAALALCGKLAYLVWLIWDVPREVLPVVDAAVLLWHSCAAQTIAGRAAPGLGTLLAAVFADVVVRVVFRLVTGWGPLACWAATLASVSQSS